MFYSVTTVLSGTVVTLRCCMGWYSACSRVLTGWYVRNVQYRTLPKLSPPENQIQQSFIHPLFDLLTSYLHQKSSSFKSFNTIVSNMTILSLRIDFVIVGCEFRLLFAKMWLFVCCLLMCSKGVLHRRTVYFNFVVVLWYRSYVAVLYGLV